MMEYRGFVAVVAFDDSMDAYGSRYVRIARGRRLPDAS